MKPSVVLGCLMSGGGRTVINLADEIDAGRLPARIGAVISSNPTAPGVERCRARGLSTHVVSRFEHPDDTARDDAIDRLLIDADVGIVCLCGYLRRFRVGERWAGRVVNIHPALLPKFGGIGMYGDRVHEAVLTAKESMSGCTVHLVDEQYDHGPTILQRTCAVLPTDTPHTLAARVFEEERIAYPEALRRLIAKLGSVAEPSSHVRPA
jgi:phosphoribosylglycinamide formyltransferase 1